MTLKMRTLQEMAGSCSTGPRSPRRPPSPPTLQPPSLPASRVLQVDFRTVLVLFSKIKVNLYEIRLEK